MTNHNPSHTDSEVFQPIPTPNDPLISRAEFAKALKLCPHSIQRMEKRGLIKSIRINARVIRYRTSELNRLLEKYSQSENPNTD